MKTLLTLFVLLFSSSVVAEDISDFQIEGMSIGDSLLDYFKEEDIQKGLETYTSFPNDYDGKFQWFQFTGYFGKTELGNAGFYIKPNDNKYIIYGINFVDENFEYFEKGIKVCESQLGDISDQISLMFPNIIINKGEYEYEPNDPPWCIKDGKLYDDTLTYEKYELDGGKIYMDCYCELFGIEVKNKELTDWLLYIKKSMKKKLIDN